MVLKCVKDEKENNTQNQSKPSNFFHRHVVTAVFIFPGRMAAEVELVPEALHSFFRDETPEILLSFVSLFFLKTGFCNKQNQSYFDTSCDECIINDDYISATYNQNDLGKRMRKELLMVQTSQTTLGCIKPKSW